MTEELHDAQARKRRARRFGRAASTYDQSAHAQRRLAQILFCDLQKRGGFAGKSVFEAGCGTGALSKQLLTLNPASLTLCDLSTAMLDSCRSALGEQGVPLSFLCADAEKDPLPQKYDLIASSAVFQWFSSLKGGLLNLKNALNPGGILAAAFYTRGTFEEMRQVSGDGIAYVSAAEAEKIAKEIFSEVSCRSLSFKTFYPDALSMLRSLKETGVSGTGGRIWTPAKLLEFTREYERRFKDERGARLSWEACELIARA